MAQQHSDELRIISYYMHGFNQGSIAVTDIIEDIAPDILLLQEHWLTPANLDKFDKFTGYFTFGRSAMSDAVEAGLLKGRPFGGVIMMISNKLRGVTETIYCSDRFCIAKIADYICVNVYLPCVGTDNRLPIIEGLFVDIMSRLERFQSCSFFYCW